jgi:ferredoxin
MRIKIDYTKCKGYALCHGEAPDVFELNDLGLALVGDEDVAPDAEGAVESAAELCPAQAIVVTPSGRVSR